MPPPSKIDLLDEDTRRELEERIVANGFGGYVQLAEWLAEKGYSIGKSTVGQYGQDLERRIAAVKASTEAAKAMEAATRDETDTRSNSIYGMFQTGIFDALLAIQEAEGEVNPQKRLALLTKAGKDFAAISRGNIVRQKWAHEISAKLDAAREEVRKLASGAGVSEETLAAIDRRLQGVV